MDAGSSIRSRVVPGSGVTMALGASSKAFKRLDLPTLGRPTRTTAIPDRRSRPRPKDSAFRRIERRTGSRASESSSAAGSAASSSGKSMETSRRAKARRSSPLRASTSREKVPLRWATAAR